MTAKKTSKKTMRKVRAKVVMPPLNKKNAEKFGDKLYSDKGGVIQCLVMCDGTLQDSQVGGRTTHCAIGEVYHTFVNRSLKAEILQDDLTSQAIEAVAFVAKLKDPSESGVSQFEMVLNELVDTNDSNYHADSEAATYVLRAQQVQETWREKIIPLLK